jgi:ribosomal protein S27AE
VKPGKAEDARRRRFRRRLWLIGAYVAFAALVAAKSGGSVGSSIGVFLVLIALAPVAVAAWKVANAQIDADAVGARNLVCPHCGTTGSVTTRPATVKQGISGGKATGAVFTGGLSLLATGLSRKQHGKQLTCGNCRMSWFVA